MHSEGESYLAVVNKVTTYARGPGCRCCPVSLKGMKAIPTGLSGFRCT